MTGPINNSSRSTSGYTGSDYPWNKGGVAQDSAAPLPKSKDGFNDGGSEDSQGDRNIDSLLQLSRSPWEGSPKMTGPAAPDLEKNQSFNPSATKGLVQESADVGFLGVNDVPDIPTVESDMPDLPGASNEEAPKKQEPGTLEKVGNNLEDASRFAGGAITGFLDAGLDAAVDTAILASNTVNTGVDVLVGPVVDAVEAVTGVQASPLLPDAQRGYDNYNKAADALESIITSPVESLEAVVEPIKSEWETGSKAEAVGRGVFEIGSVLVGGAGALGKLPSGKKPDLDVDVASSNKQNLDDFAAVASQSPAELRISAMKNEGHAPQRHGADVTKQQLEDRALYGKDPITGTRTDGVTGGMHGYSKHATKFDTDKVMVEADNHLRSHVDFDAAKSEALDAGKTRFDVERPIEEVLGTDYESTVTGVSRGGSRAHPTGNPPGSKPPAPTEFENGTVLGVYEIAPDGSVRTHTLFPDPSTN